MRTIGRVGALVAGLALVGILATTFVVAAGQGDAARDWWAPAPAPATNTLPALADAIAADPGAWLLGAFGLCLLIGTFVVNWRLSRRDD